MIVNVRFVEAVKGSTLPPSPERSDLPGHPQGAGGRGRDPAQGLHRHLVDLGRAVSETQRPQGGRRGAQGGREEDVRSCSHPLLDLFLEAPRGLEERGEELARRLAVLDERIPGDSDRPPSVVIGFQPGVERSLSFCIAGVVPAGGRACDRAGLMGFHRPPHLMLSNSNGEKLCPCNSRSASIIIALQVGRV